MFFLNLITLYFSVHDNVIVLLNIHIELADCSSVRTVCWFHFGDMDVQGDDYESYELEEDTSDISVHTSDLTHFEQSHSDSENEAEEGRVNLSSDAYRWSNNTTKLKIERVAE